MNNNYSQNQTGPNGLKPKLFRIGSNKNMGYNSTTNKPSHGYISKLPSTS